MTVDGVRGNLEIRTSYDPIQVSRVQGNLLITANNAAVTADGIGGATIDVTTSYEKVALGGFSAEVRVSNRNGNVTLAPLDLKHGMDVRNEYGEITLAWPDGETARLEAQSKGGTVHWGLDGKPDVDQSNGMSLVKAFTANAGGAAHLPVGEIRRRPDRARRPQVLESFRRISHGRFRPEPAVFLPKLSVFRLTGVDALGDDPVDLDVEVGDQVGHVLLVLRDVADEIGALLVAQKVLELGHRVVELDDIVVERPVLGVDVDEVLARRAWRSRGAAAGSGG